MIATPVLEWIEQLEEDAADARGRIVDADAARDLVVGGEEKLLESISVAQEALRELLTTAEGQQRPSAPERQQPAPAEPQRPPEPEPPPVPSAPERQKPERPARARAAGAHSSRPDVTPDTVFAAALEHGEPASSSWFVARFNMERKSMRKRLEALVEDRRLVRTGAGPTTRYAVADGAGDRADEHDVDVDEPREDTPAPALSPTAKALASSRAVSGPTRRAIEAEERANARKAATPAKAPAAADPDAELRTKIEAVLRRGGRHTTRDLARNLVVSIATVAQRLAELKQRGVDGEGPMILKNHEGYEIDAAEASRWPTS